MTTAVETAARENQQLIDELWDFADAAASQERFRAAADLAPGQRHDVLLTQAARALGLLGQFDDALAELDGLTSAAVRDVAAPEVELAVRVLLERGPVLNSSGSPADARPLLEAAYERASSAELEHLAIDALHMVAIIAPADEQVAHTERARTLASRASDPRARDWRASLLNNVGWARFEAGEYEAALPLFTEAVEERIGQGKAREIGVARWSVGRTMRALGRNDEALAAQGSAPCLDICGRHQRLVRRGGDRRMPGRPWPAR